MKNNNKIIILQIKQGLFNSKILIEALGDCEVIYGSIFGDKVFYLNKGTRKWVRVSKSFCYCEDEVLSFSTVCNSSTVHQFPWDWYYGYY